MDERGNGFGTFVVWCLRLLSLPLLLAGAVQLLQLLSIQPLSSALSEARFNLTALIMVGFWASGLALLGLAELLRVAIAIEANTHRAAMARPLLQHDGETRDVSYLLEAADAK
jgi:hypothetical protein